MLTCHTNVHQISHAECYAVTVAQCHLLTGESTQVNAVLGQHMYVWFAASNIQTSATEQTV